MAKAYLFLAPGFEDIEAIAPVDILRRAGIDVRTVSIHDMRYVDSTHGITIKADHIFREADVDNADLLILPGGMPGAEELASSRRLAKALVDHNNAGKLTGAICAAPMVLGMIGLLQDRRATCYPGFEKYLKGATYTAAKVETDGNIITAYGPGAALDFAFALVRQLLGNEVVENIKKGMMVK